MKNQALLLPALAAGACALILLPTRQVEAYSTIGGSLSQAQRDFRVYNNFSGTAENNNTAADPSFPGYNGAVVAIWKASVEWGSLPHGDGSGDPTQATLGAAGANFDASFQGLATQVGGTNDNIHSQISGSSGGVLAYAETPISDGWRIRYYENWSWADGPGTIESIEMDLQGVACHEYGHALGLGHSTATGATMAPSILQGVSTARSITNDDRAGIQSIYGQMSASKPIISGVQIANGKITILGSNFDISGNQIWFTRAAAGGNGVPIKVTNITSNGTELKVTIPGLAGPGDVLVRRNGTGHSALSNAWPTDLLPSTSDCPAPVTYCNTSPNSVGSGAQIGSTGTASLAQNNLTLTVLGCPANKPGLFYYGPDQALAPLGNGLRCVGGSTVRLPAIVTNMWGTATLSLDLASGIFLSGAAAATPGNSANFQFWYRDPADGGAKFNLSDALAVTYCP